jgi:acyl dehydratase
MRCSGNGKSSGGSTLKGTIIEGSSRPIKTDSSRWTGVISEFQREDLPEGWVNKRMVKKGMPLEVKKIRYFDDFQIGDKIVTRGRTITETDIVLFSAYSGDWHPLHTNVEFAKKGPFGERIAHGYLVLCVASGLMPMEEMAVMANYGMDRLRFLEPTRIGDTIHVELEVVEKKERNGKSGVISFRTNIRSHKRKDLVVFIQKVLVARE